MLSLIVVSDSHGKFFLLNEVIKRQLKLDKAFRPSHLIHLGDGIADLDSCDIPDGLCVSRVKGNCDNIFYVYSNSIPEERVFELFGYKIVAFHGNAYSVKSGYERAVDYAFDIGADLLLFGHTHIPISYTVKRDDRELTVFNPGSLKDSLSFGVITFDEQGIQTSFGKL